MTLRGAGVDVDVRRAARAAIGLCLAALATLAILGFLAGAQKNAQINRLRQHGVAVEVTVSKCIGLMGGSGSNVVGYQCTGSLTVGGRRYNETLPGHTLRAPGSTVRAVMAPGDPPLLGTPSAVAAERASWTVFVLPTLLLLVFLLLVSALIIRRRAQARSPLRT